MTNKGNNIQLSNLIIAGVNKAGSTSLFHYLCEHPDVCGSKDKETCYFLPLLYGQSIGPVSDYEEQFKHCDKSIYRLEATPAYVYGGQKIAREIHSVIPDVKILIILKNPVERLISFYRRKKATFQLPDDMTLDEYIKACASKTDAELALIENQIYTGITLGEYDTFIEPWLKTFGKNVNILFFDDLKQNTCNFMMKVASWLDIDPEFYRHFDFDIKNKSQNYKNRYLHRFAVTANKTGQRFWRSNPAIKKVLLNTYYRMNGKPFNSEELREENIRYLMNHFAPHNLNLQQILAKYGYHEVPDWMDAEKVTA